MCRSSHNRSSSTFLSSFHFYDVLWHAKQVFTGHKSGIASSESKQLTETQNIRWYVKYCECLSVRLTLCCHVIYIRYFMMHCNYHRCKERRILGSFMKSSILRCFEQWFIRTLKLYLYGVPWTFITLFVTWY